MFEIVHVCVLCVFANLVCSFARVSFVAPRSWQPGIPTIAHEIRVLWHATRNIVNIGRHRSRAIQYVCEGLGGAGCNVLYIQSVGPQPHSLHKAVLKIAG